MKGWSLERIARATAGRLAWPSSRATLAGNPEEGREVTGVSIDSRTVAGGALFFAIPGPRFDGHDFLTQARERGAVAAVVHRGRPVPADFPIIEVENVVLALGRLATAYRATFAGRVIAVTGSNGKTTVKGMIGAVLGSRYRVSVAARSHNNAIGVPLTLLAADPADDFVVVEMGTNAFGEIAHLTRLTRPDVGVLTAVSAAHLAGLETVDGVRREKVSLFDGVRDGGLAVAQQEALADTARSQRLRWLTYDRDRGADVVVSDVRGNLSGVTCRIDGLAVQLSVPGAHNALNAAAAVAVGQAFGLDDTDLAVALAGFATAEGRSRLIVGDHFRLLDDTYNANPGSMAAAIEMLAGEPGRRVLIAGEMGELGPRAAALHAEIGALAGARRIDVVIGVGPLTRYLVADARSSGGVGQAVYVEDTGAAERGLEDWLVEGDTVLVKGSRSARLERIAEAIQRLPFATATTGAEAGPVVGR